MFRIVIENCSEWHTSRFGQKLLHCPSLLDFTLKMIDFHSKYVPILPDRDCAAELSAAIWVVNQAFRNDDTAFDRTVRCATTKSFQ